MDRDTDTEREGSVKRRRRRQRTEGSAQKAAGERGPTLTDLPSQPAEVTKSADTRISALKPPGLRNNKSQLLGLPGFWCFVTAALPDRCRECVGLNALPPASCAPGRPISRFLCGPQLAGTTSLCPGGVQLGALSLQGLCLSAPPLG